MTFVHYVGFAFCGRDPVHGLLSMRQSNDSPWGAVRTHDLLPFPDIFHTPDSSVKHENFRSWSEALPQPGRHLHQVGARRLGLNG